MIRTDELGSYLFVARDRPRPVFNECQDLSWFGVNQKHTRAAHWHPDPCLGELRHVRSSLIVPPSGKILRHLMSLVPMLSFPGYRKD